MNKMTKQEAYDFLKNKKVKVTPKQSKKVQEIAFKLGFHWEYSKTSIKYLDRNFLFFKDDGHITYCESVDCFEEHRFKEINVEEILDLVTIEDYEDGIDAVSHPSHYNNYSVEVLEMMRRIWGDEKVAIFCELNAFKYRMRMGLKEGNPTEQDLAKEKFYLEYMKKLNK